MRLLILLLGFAAFSVNAQSLFDSHINALLDSTLKPFYFGVASGDPQQQEVIIWTKVWSEDNKPVKVKWEIATDTSMQHVVGTNEVITDSASAYTVKIPVTALQPGTTYFYRFQSGDRFSPIGRTKTAPVQANMLRFAVVSCSNYEHGYFNAYRLLANRNDLDAVIHLGDYIYEYGINRHAKHPHVREHIPEHEIVSLQDYRSRYAQYRLDKDLQEVHRLHPFITEWDDHEFANDTYKDGAGNHQSSEGEWSIREAIAKKVYFEWIPIKDNPEESIIRKMNYGNMADIFMLDGRTVGRCKQVENQYDTSVNNINQCMLGKEQTNWLISGVQNSAAHWKVISNQVIFSELDAHKLLKKHARNLDAWDGYPQERKEILDSFYQHNIKNLVVITGDIHTSWAFDLVKNPQDKNSYNKRTGKGVIGAEFVAPSISSNNLAERLPRGLANLVGKLLITKTNPHLRFDNMVDHGYILLDLTEEKAKATWVFNKTVEVRTTKFSAKNSWSTKYNANRLVRDK